MTIPEEAKDRLINLADAGEMVWQQVAVIVIDLAAQPGAQKMRVYQDAGALLGMKSAGVRSWCGTYQAVGDDLLAEFPQLRYTHWRVLSAAARKFGKGLAELAVFWASSADDYGGMPVPPDVLAAKLGNPKVLEDPYVKAFERAGAAIVAATKPVDPDDKETLNSLNEMADWFQKSVERYLEAVKNGESPDAPAGSG